MGIIVLGIAIADLITSEEVEDLKQQINDIVNKHKAISDKVMKIQKDLENLSMEELGKKLKEMNQALSQNLQTIIEDQQKKLELAKRIDVTVAGEDPNVLLTTIMKTLNVVLVTMDLVEMMCATDPATIAISGVLAILGAILNVFSIVNNIEEIEELEAKKEKLLKYYEPGGDFEKSLEQVATYAYQVIENFYLIVVGFRSMVYELEINVNLLALSRRSPNINYTGFLQVLEQNPFDAGFQLLCRQTYIKFLNIQSLPLQQKVNQSCRLLQDFQDNNYVMQRMKIAKKIADYFRKDSIIGMELENASTEVKKLTSLKEYFQVRFVKRMLVQETMPWSLPQFDKDLADDLLDQARKMEEAELGVAEVVSFYTTQFFADDPSGKTLFKMNLKDVSARMQFLNYLGVTSKNQNLIYLPSPRNPDLQRRWIKIVDFLILQYKMHHPLANFEFKKLYIRMQLGTFEVNHQKQSRLNYFYGIKVKVEGSTIDDSFEMEITDVEAGTQKKAHHEKKVYMEKVERKSKDLKSLCRQLCFLVNGVAYPDRVLGLGVTKEEGGFKCHIEWSQRTVKQQFFGKMLSYSIEKGETKIHDKEKVFQVVPVSGTHTFIVLREK